MHRRAPVTLAALVVAIAACGTESQSAPAPPMADSTIAAAAEPAAPVALLPSQVDLRSEDLLPAAEIESNLLPSVVLDDLSADRKVNFRNLVPQELPVLVWMWAPN